MDHGIRNSIDPGPPFEGDAYQADVGLSFPRSLHQSVERVRDSSLAESAFGADVVDQYVTFYEWECKLFDEAVTDWELFRYFENT